MLALWLMTALGQKQTSSRECANDRCPFFPWKRTFIRATVDRKQPLLDHLVSTGEKRGRPSINYDGNPGQDGRPAGPALQVLRVQSW
jgi:hypothetical protein